jgi:hypothetical protein
MAGRLAQHCGAPWLAFARAMQEEYFDSAFFRPRVLPLAHPINQALSTPGLPHERFDITTDLMAPKALLAVTHIAHADSQLRLRHFPRRISTGPDRIRSFLHTSPDLETSADQVTPTAIGKWCCGRARMWDQPGWHKCFRIRCPLKMIT